MPYFKHLVNVQNVGMYWCDIDTGPCAFLFIPRAVEQGPPSGPIVPQSPVSLPEKDEEETAPEVASGGFSEVPSTPETRPQQTTPDPSFATEVRGSMCVGMLQLYSRCVQTKVSYRMLLKWCCYIFRRE